jgi:rubrerythrin
LASEKILAGKKSYVEGVKEIIGASMGGVVFNYKGITVEEDTKLRKELREAGVHYEVIKNTMLKIAIKGTEIEGLSEDDIVAVQNALDAAASYEDESSVESVPADEIEQTDSDEEVYECPECGGKITVDMTVCPNCGIEISFEYEDEE